MITISNAISFLVGLWIGGTVGVLVMCLCNAAAYADQIEEMPGRWYYPDGRREDE